MGSIKAAAGENWANEDVWEGFGLFNCVVCQVPYPTQREADLCTPAYLIPHIYGMDSVTPEVAIGIPADWLD